MDFNRFFDFFKETTLFGGRWSSGKTLVFSPVKRGFESEVVYSINIIIIKQLITRHNVNSSTK